jgi:WD domain, G-beta repeat
VGAVRGERGSGRYPHQRAQMVCRNALVDHCRYRSTRCAVQQSAGKAEHFVLSVAYSPDGKSIACGSMDGSVSVIDVETKQVKSQLGGHFKPVRSVTFSPGALTLILPWQVQAKQICHASGTCARLVSMHCCGAVCVVALHAWCVQWTTGRRPHHLYTMHMTLTRQRIGVVMQIQSKCSQHVTTCKCICTRQLAT